MCFERSKHNGAYTRSGNRSFFFKFTQDQKMEGKGDCLFHADGGALRIDVADFLEAKALEPDGFEETWLHKSGKAAPQVLGEATT